MDANEIFPNYPLPDVNAPVEAPSYAAAIDWMKSTEGKNVSLDFWARGNYVRRLLYNRSNNINPLLVQIRNEKEMAWAYKRLALLGKPLEFIYSGQCNKGKVLHLCPWDLAVDSGWGYIAAMGDKANINGRDFYVILGHAKLMPEGIVNFIVDNLSEEFVRGDVFVAPAELIGLKSKVTRNEMFNHGDLTNGTPIINNYGDVKSIMEINIPFIDSLSISNFKKLINDYGEHLINFRDLFHIFAASRNVNEQSGIEILKGIKNEIDELLKSDKHIPFRNIIKVAGGTIGFVATAVSATSGDVASILAFAGTSLVGIDGVCDIHNYLRGRLRNKYIKIMSSPYALFWKLGIAKPETTKGGKKAFLGPPPKMKPSEFDENVDYHWLCPPTSGMLLLAMTKE